MEGCVICGKPRSPKDGIVDRCGHHRRQLLRHRGKSPKPQPSPPTEEPSTLEAASPSELKQAHASGKHAGRLVVACVLCLRERGGRADHVEVLSPPNRK